MLFCIFGDMVLIDFMSKWFRAILFVAMVGIAMLAQSVQAETVQNYWSAHGDINEDGITDVNDVMVIADNWLTYLDPSTNYDRHSLDRNGDGWVNLVDFAIVAENYGWVKPAGAAMEAYVSKYVSEEGNEDHPYVGIAVQVHNISPVDTDYDMKEVTFNSGTNNGVEYFWEEESKWETRIDPNESVAWKVTGATYIGSGEYKLFRLYVVGNPGEDPNNFGFKRDYVEAKTQGDTNLDFTPLKVDLPTRK